LVLADEARDTEQEKKFEGQGTSDSRVLYVGIGGTGKEIVSRVKARLKAVGGGEVSSKVGFLVIDVDPSQPKSPDLQSVLSPTEVCHPAERQLPSQVLDAIRDKVEGNAAAAWVGERVPPGEMTLEYNNFIRGTERYRQAGLLAYLWEETNAGVSVPLRAAIERVTTGARDSVALSVFVICSICGGTGSGMLLDVGYLARSIGLPYSAGSCDVSAILVLPGVFRRLVDDATYSDLKRNASAVLAELDYFMYPKAQRVSRTCNRNDVNWPLRSASQEGLLLDTDGAIFQSVFLIDNQRNNGSTLGGTETVFPSVADMLVHMSGALIGNSFLEALNNAKATLRRRLVMSRPEADMPPMPHYSSLGLARIVLPVQKMAIEAAAVLSQDVLAALQGGAETPAEAAIHEARRNLGIEPEGIVRDLGLARGDFVNGLAKVIDLRSPAVKSGRIGAVSERVAEFTRQKSPPDAIRRYCLDALDKARRAMIAAHDQAQRLSTGRLAGSAETIQTALNDELGRMRAAGRGLAWFSQLLARVIESADKSLVEARQAAARDRGDAVGRVELELQKALDKLGGCPPNGVRQAAQMAAKKCDDWLRQRLDLAAAQMRERVLDDSYSRLRKISDAANSLIGFLSTTLPAETPRAVAALCRKEHDEAPITDIRVSADGRRHYEAARNISVREKALAECLKTMTFELREGDLYLCCDVNWTTGKPLVIGASLQPFEAARDWVEYLAGRLSPHFASHRLDDYILTAEDAGRYANACAKEAEAFVKYNLTEQQAGGGDPIVITVVVAPADSRLEGAFSDGRQGRICTQDKDPTTAIVFRADIGILGKVLQFRKEATALEASMVSMKGLWTLGQVSHNIFWRDPDRWGNLRLFFLSVAAHRIHRQEARIQIRRTERVGHEYSLDIGSGQKAPLGLGLQSAILEFLSPNNEANRRKLWTDLGESHMKEDVDATLPAVRREYAEIAKQPAEVPTAHLREVLRLFLDSLCPEEDSTPPGKAVTSTPKKTKSGKTDTAAG
jgi:hypothetical protein